MWVKKIRVQKNSFVPQEKLLDLEKMLDPKNTGQKQIWIKKVSVYEEKNLGSNKYFGSNKAQTGLTKTLSLTEV